MPTLEQIFPKAPMIRFGPFGPILIIRDDGRETQVTYKRGRIAEIIRYDGAVLRLKRDALQKPVSLHLGDGYEAAFYHDPGAGPVFMENARMIDGPNGAEIHLTNKTVIYPDNQPELTANLIVSRFAVEVFPK